MLTLRPISLRATQEYIKEHHRHNQPPRGHKFSSSVVDDEGNLRGVGVLGRPVSRHLDDGLTAEITRVCTDGAPNACSMLYGSLRRAAKALGYTKVITYTLQSESGASLKAAGFHIEAELPATAGWSRPSRGRDNELTPNEAKYRWVA